MLFFLKKQSNTKISVGACLKKPLIYNRRVVISRRNRRPDPGLGT